MSKYVLGLRQEGGQADHAMAFRTACKAIDYLVDWRQEGGTVTVILRVGKAIDDQMLRRDADKEKGIPRSRRSRTAARAIM